MLRSLFFLMAATAAWAQTPAALFETHCAVCHNPTNTIGAPLPETLHAMTWQNVLMALENGKMKGIGDAMDPKQREAIAKFIGTAAATQQIVPAARCSGTAPALGAGVSGAWADAANTRFESAKTSGLNETSTPRLKLKWAFGFPGMTTAFGAPTVAGGRVFIGSADGMVYSLDAHTGCTYWSYTAAAGVRVAPVIGRPESGTEAYAWFGDLRGNVYALHASTGALVWKVHAEENPLGVITGSLKLDRGQLYVPVSGRDESIAATNPSYECCSFRGSVVALDAASGTRIWTAYTIADTPRETGQNAKGTKTWGPSGAVPWSAPTLDLQKRVLYIGTGVNYSNPPTDTSDAVVAIDMKTGRLLWSRQFTQADSWNFACVGKDKTNCPRLAFIDTDFGNSGILRSLHGKRFLVISDKGGTVYAIDPDREGRILWKQKIAAGGVNGGTMWGGASDERGVVYIGISDFTAGKPETGGGLIALEMATGRKLWSTPAPKPACIAIPGCSAAQPAPVTVTPGVAFLGSWDGHIRAYETRRGKIIWDFDTARTFETVNGVRARGGSITSTGAALSNGMLY
ncbi:MAG: PQQ-binding-like beta-propeller repeat protein, partial [Acidobacteriota bacterium]|nr:PQQ-binding-like beta-propeller repeat protein [Acidobacteriota bacterium]